MSSSVAKALRLTGGDEAVETANFVEIVDKLFDCLNVSSMSKGTLRLIGICGSMIHREAVAKAIALNSLFKTLKSYRYAFDNERPHSKMYMYCYGTNYFNVV